MKVRKILLTNIILSFSLFANGQSLAEQTITINNKNIKDMKNNVERPTTNIEDIEDINDDSDKLKDTSYDKPKPVKEIKNNKPSKNIKNNKPASVNIKIDKPKEAVKKYTKYSDFIESPKKDKRVTITTYDKPINYLEHLAEMKRNAPKPVITNSIDKEREYDSDALTYPPEVIYKLNIDLSKYNLEKYNLIMSNIKKYKNLEELKIVVSDNLTLSDNIYDNENLKKLVIRPIRTNVKLPSGLNRLKNLEYLKLNDYNIYAEPYDLDELAKLSKLKYLEMNFDQDVLEIPKQISNNKSIEQLKLHGYISKISPSIKNLTNLNVLEIKSESSEPISIPNEISYLKNLKSLNLFGENILDFPDELTKLDNLTELKLSSTNITYSSNIFDLKSLSTLQLSSLTNNSILNISPDISKCQSLKELIISSLGANIVLTKQIGELEKIEKLIITGRTDSIPFDLSNFKNLESFGFSANRIGNYNYLLNRVNSNLKELYLDGNNLKSIPFSVTRFKELRKLSLSRNEISLGGDEYEYLTLLQKLESLNLSQNKISYFRPTIIKKLSNLKELTLNSNKLLSLKNKNDILNELFKINRPLPKEVDGLSMKGKELSF